MLVCLKACGGSSLSSGGDEEEESVIWPVELEPKLWRLLSPELLLECILPRLPLLSLLSLRCVCSSWRFLLSSPRFWRRWFQSHPSNPPLLALYYARRASLFCPRLASKPVSRWRKWHKIRFVPSSPPSPTPGPGRWRCVPTEFLASCSPFRILSSHGGLFLLKSLSSPSDTLQLLVCNPLSRTCRELPPVSAPSLGENFHFSATTSVDSELGEYVIICRGDDWCTYHIYESSSQQWKVVLVERDWDASPRQAAPTTTYGDLNWFSGDWDTNTHSYVAIYDRQRKTLIETPTWWPGTVFLSQRRQIWGGSQGLMTVAFFENCVGIWRLASTSWLQTETLPSEAAEGIRRGGEIRFDCVKLGDSICLSTPNSGRVFLYDMVKKTGEWSCRCPYSTDLIQSFAFEPRHYVEV